MDGHQVPGSYILYVYIYTIIYKSCIVSLFPATFHTSKRLDTPLKHESYDRIIRWIEKKTPGTFLLDPVLCSSDPVDPVDPMAMIHPCWCAFDIQSMEMPRQLLDPPNPFCESGGQTYRSLVLLPTNVANFPI